MVQWPRYETGSFFVNNIGIYWQESAYGDAVDTHYVVQFGKHDTNEQFLEFQKRLKEMGGNKRGLEVLTLLVGKSRL